MNAIGFVKKFGLGKVIELLNRIESETEFLLNYSDTYLYPVQLKSDWCNEDEFSQYCESELYWVSRSMSKDDEDINDHWFASVLELKQIVEAFELVEYCNGLEDAKELLDEIDSERWVYNLYTNTVISSDYSPCDNMCIKYDVLKQAIELVEKCK